MEPKRLAPKITISTFYSNSNEARMHQLRIQLVADEPFNGTEMQTNRAIR